MNSGFCKVCLQCGFLAPSQTVLTHHFLRCPSRSTPYVQHSCPDCVAHARTAYLLRRHRILSAHSPIHRDFKPVLPRAPPPMQYFCSRCEFQTRLVHKWGIHLNQHARKQLKKIRLSSQRKPKPRGGVNSSASQQNSDNQFSCPECDFTCRRKDMHLAHMKQHGKKSSVAKCDQCPYTTSNPYNLMKHKRTHTGEKPFKCSYCPYRSADSGNLNKHINSHHGPGKARRAVAKRKTSKKPATKQLKQSDSATKSPTKPSKALADKTETVSPPSRPELPASPPPTATSQSASGLQQDFQYKCTECDYICNNEQFLVAHLSIHRKMGDQYVCSVCNYSSRNQQNLAKHVRTHTGEKPYKCQYCVYSAADKGNLNKHVKTHHKKELAQQEMAQQELAQQGNPPTSQ